MRPKDEDIDYGIEIQGVYDGVAVWVLKDGTMVNRFAGEPGYERRATRIQDYIDFNMSAEKRNKDGQA